MRKNLFFVVGASLMITGCAMPPTPQNGKEFRSIISQGGYGTAIETFIVKRPYKEVAANIKAKSNECLNTKIERRSCSHTTSSTNCNDYADRYTAKVVDGASKTEVHVQFIRAGEGVGTIQLGGKAPANGNYMLVADITPAENGKSTKIDMYSAKVFKAAPNAIKHWANGTSQGCPTFKDL